MQTKAKPVYEFFHGHPERWCQGALARTAHANVCAVEDPRAVQFCLVGAVCFLHDAPCEREDILKRLHESLLKRLHESLPSFNDSPSTTFADVLALVQRADV